MTLNRQLSLGVLLSLLVIFVGTYLITVNNSRNYYMEQLQNNAQDTATSLGLSLTHALTNKDNATMLSMVQAVFDRGYFASIQVKDINNKLLISRYLAKENGEVPHWFVALIAWPQKSQSAVIMEGWRQMGEVQVIPDNQTAYLALWRNALALVKAYVVFVVISLLLVYGFIRSLLKPLNQVMRQAQAISEHEFTLETNIPKTLELKEVTLAMNQMVSKVKAQFEEQMKQAETLRSQVYLDALTGLSNRRHFMQQLNNLLSSDDEFIPGHVLFLVVDGLDDLNQQQGYQKGDELVLAITHLCKRYWDKPTVACLARINGSTFAMINYERDEQEFDKQCKSFEQLLAQISAEYPICKITMGAVAYFFHQSPSNLLSVLDLAVKNARESGVYYCKKVMDQFKFPRKLNKDEILEALEENRIALYSQAVSDGSNILHHEIFARMVDKLGEELGAGYFLPLAEKEEIAYLIDLYVLNLIIEKDANLKHDLAINLSRDTLCHPEKSDAYLKQLKKLDDSLREHLVLEFSEELLLDSLTHYKDFLNSLRELGVRIGIDRMGVHFSSYDYLADIHLDYVKLHGSLVQDIDENQSKQFFIHYFTKMANTLDIKVIATQIEYEAQWKTVQDIQVNWGQGQYLAKIKPLKIG